MFDQHSEPTNDLPKYWFPAKRYGWGWGLPATWQGWLTMIMFFVLVFASLFFARDSVAIMITGNIMAIAFLLAICFWKGEPPQWRWGNDKTRK